MAARDELTAGRRTRPLRRKLLNLINLNAIRHFRRKRKPPPVVPTRGIRNIALIPLVKGNTPWVIVITLTVPLQSCLLRVIPPNPAIIDPLRPVRRLHLRMQKPSFTKIKCPTRIRRIRRNSMMRVMGVKPTHQNFHAVGTIITVIVNQQTQVRLLRDIHPLGRNLKTNRKLQFVRKYNLFVRPSVPVRVLVNQQFVVRLGITRPPVRIRRRNRHPQPPPIVETHLHWIPHVREFSFRRE